MGNILVIDDDKVICDILCSHFTGMKFNADCSFTLKQGIEKLYESDIDVVFLDVNLPDGNGLEAIPTILEHPSRPEVIIITAEADRDGAELAIKNGAWHYIEKPFIIPDIELSIARVMEYRNEKKKETSVLFLNREGIIGNSVALNRCLEQLARIAGSNANVLITGETGTGKELFARAIHKSSTRSNQKMITVDCTALPENLVESTLFGHVKGAFTGANTGQDGLVLQANGGTLFLDEVGELPLGIQKKFLRVLQEHCFRPVGSRKELKSNFRVIAATNRDLEAMCSENAFRSDLMFRLKSLHIHLPPLRERNEDIKDLVVHYINRICEREGINAKGLSPEFFESLSYYPWPGNVRELVNALEATISQSWTEQTLYAIHLPMNIRISAAQRSIGQSNGKSASSSACVSYHDFRKAAIAHAEKRYFKELIQASNNNIKEAIHISGLSRSRLYELLKKYALSLSE